MLPVDFTLKNVTIYYAGFYEASYIEGTVGSRVHIALKTYPGDFPVWVWVPQDQVAEWLFGSQKQKGATRVPTERDPNYELP